jgi:hypothetical protein
MERRKNRDLPGSQLGGEGGVIFAAIKKGEMDWQKFYSSIVLGGSAGT